MSSLRCYDGSDRSRVNIARLDLVSLQLVIVCAQEGSLTRAAPICCMSLMAASRRLRILEEAVGATLFQRRRNSLQPTEACVSVVSSAREILRLAEELMIAARHAPIPHGRLHDNTGRKRCQATE